MYITSRSQRDREQLVCVIQSFRIVLRELRCQGTQRLSKPFNRNADKDKILSLKWLKHLGIGGTQRFTVAFDVRKQSQYRFRVFFFLSVASTVTESYKH